MFIPRSELSCRKSGKDLISCRDENAGGRNGGAALPFFLPKSEKAALSFEKSPLFLFFSKKVLIFFLQFDILGVLKTAKERKL